MAPQPDTGSGDSAFRELVIEVLERLDRDGPGAIEAACDDHPELASKLRQRIDALRGLGLVGGGAPSERVGEFRLVDKIGAGGMGVVYRAVQESLGREVAIKLIRPEILGLSKARERFERETAVIARLQHPGIVPIYTVGQDQDRPYYAMEWVRGCTLEQALRELEGRAPGELSGADLQRAVQACSPGDAGEQDSGGYLFEGSWEEACLRIVAQVADALEHAHRRGVLHRDVKPGNVLITPGGRVMLVDFGLSQVDGEQTLTRSGERLGSVHFMSPELLRSGPQRLDARSDVYSLGVTLFRLLTLEQPFSGGSEVAVLQNVLEGRPRRPREHLPTISWEAETVCLVAMDRDPERRYPTAAAFGRDLLNALERRPVEARRASLRLRAWRWLERRPGEATAIALFVLLAVTVPTLVAWFQSREAKRAGEALADVTAEQQRTEEQRRRAEEQRGRAEENFAIALETVDTLLRKVGEERLVNVPELVQLQGELAQAAEVVYRQLLERQPGDSELARLAAGSQRLRAISYKNQGRSDEALALLREAIAGLEPWLGEGSYELRRMHALCLQAVSALEVAPAHQLAALTALRELLAERPDDLELRLILVQAQRVDAMLPGQFDDREMALAHLARTEVEARDLVALDPYSDARVVLARVLELHAGFLWNQGRFKESRGKYEESLELFRVVLDEEPEREDVRGGVAKVSVLLGAVLAQDELDEDSLFVLEEARGVLDGLIEDFPGYSEYLEDLADLHKNRGITLAKVRRYDEAVETLELAIATYKSIERRFPALGGKDFELGIAYTNLALTLSNLADFDAALAAMDVARDHILASNQHQPDNVDAASWVGVERITRASILLKIPRPAEAAEALADAPRLVAHRVDRVDQVLERLAVAIDKARATDDAELIARVELAARRGLESAVARGDAGDLSSLSELRALLELP